MGLINRLHEASATAWLRFLEWVNGIAIALVGAIVVVHQAYPQVIAGAVGRLPPIIGIPLIFGFGLLVHYALRRAKAEAGGK